jgi:NAD(P)-dependent dehydrogenase (short-subunit alcohol dehydrogenase family)
MNAVDSSARAIRVSPELWRETTDANLTGVVHPGRATPPGMIERPGEAGPLDPRYPTGAAPEGRRRPQIPNAALGRPRAALTATLTVSATAPP